MPQLAFLSTAHIHTRSFLETIRGHERATTRAIWDDITERGQRYADDFEIPFVPDLDAVLSDPKVDGFVICSENTRHLPLLEKVLPVGKPVMCEKPLATRVADARRIVQLLAQYPTALTSGYFHPFSGTLRGAKSAMDQGLLGQVTHAHYRNAHHAAYGRWFDSPDLAWFADPKLAGGGALMDMGTHAVHLLRHLMGPVEQVWAMTANLSGQYDTVDDYGVIQMKFANGAVGRAEAGWCFTLSQGGLELIGSTQSLWSRDDQLVMAAPGQDPAPIPDADARPDRIHRLIAIIEDQLDPEEQARDVTACLDTVAIMDAAYQSTRSGRWEPVTPMGAGWASA